MTTQNEEKNTKRTIPLHVKIERGETQKDVNITLLNELINRINPQDSIKALDLPCGQGNFLAYIKQLFPNSTLYGADIVPPDNQSELEFYEMDLTKDFEIPDHEQFDLITSVSGVMMFENTKNFIENCSKHLKNGGEFVVTNDNSATIIDRLSFLSIGRTRQFRLVYDDDEGLKQNLSIQYLVRILRLNQIEIEKITYTSFYPKDLIFLPIILLFAPLQWMYLKRTKHQLPISIVKQMFSFKQFLYKHYIIYGKKKESN